MGILGSVFGTEKAVSNIVDKDNGLLAQVGGWIGGMKYTDQERAAGNKDIREWGIRQLEALAPFKVVQRIIAFSVVGVWAFIIFNLIVAIWIRAIWPEIDAVDALWKLLIADVVFWPVVSVLSLYFTGGVVKPGIFGAKNK